MKTLTLVLCLFFSVTASAESVYPDVESYLRNATGNNTKEYVHVLNSQAYGEKNFPRVFGVVFNKSHDPREGKIFVLRRRLDGKLVLEAESAKFDFSDPSARTYIEIVEANGPDRFYVQFGLRSACGVYVDIYRFKKTKNEWQVSGADKYVPTCNEDGSIGFAEKISINFLTGLAVTEKYHNDKLISIKKAKRRYPKFRLEDFIPYGEKYEKR